MKLLVIILSITISFSATAADSLYHPKADARKEIALAVAKARAQNKHVLIQAGGNWCGWCIEFNRFVTNDTSLNSIIQSNYIVYHLNYSQENKNAAIFKEYGFPNRFGFPVFLVLNADGNLIHTQNSSYLELGKSYDARKVKEFLLSWTNNALQASSYPYLYQ
ncbi:MAG: thioredoxin family protein [Bacteroidetes bacterium]|nr:thioredoxin family protein [Bacteroidota bacterium]